MSLEDEIPATMSITMKFDEEGFLGRECPGCEAYFKITPGTGLSDIDHCVCPYCGTNKDANSFWTKDQIEHATSIVLNRVSTHLIGEMRGIADRFSSPRGGFLRITMEVSGRPTEVHQYAEKDLETTLVCANCSLCYAVYGLFAFCPDCGSHNSLQILEKNFELAQKILHANEGSETDVAQAIQAAALTQIISAFDGFGREVARQFDLLKGNTKPSVSSFQSISKARERMLNAFNVDFTDGIREDEWTSLRRLFQKRHLIVHKLGVVDDDYIQATDDPRAVLGRKVKIFQEEVPSAMAVLMKVGSKMYSALEKQRANK
ncbi:MAG: hypothetical protein HY915_06285 [Desulfovibrio sp.]|nr:hypothetical protein [Desulfovibrio sp.]